jgi:hypothetical protein
VHAVDNQGNYLGLMPKESSLQVPDAPPDNTNWIWNSTLNRWSYTPPLATAILEAISAVNACSGSARVKYMTVLPGQETTYNTKRQQADRYITNYANNVNAPVPPYIQAEALVTGTTAIIAANSIADAANILDDILVSIERERRRGKIRITASTNITEVNNRKAAAIDALNAI